ncbi:DUF4225 domain-containing protein [Pseudomonas sp. UMAB-08]|uniref:DUF4225 domain-containing protein n=1 Tax=Pseudomonas sp. UMAB-08 TaxID=1365375 RepID=UPI001C56131B|nr:DUF4225 domain-containing protein [Pseudomonas sp. UMAB-08]
MEQINKKQKPSSDDYSRVTHAAGVLASQACSVSALHIKDGMLRIQFNREVAYYARGIVRDVVEGRKSAEQGLKEIGGEQKSLWGQSLELGQKSAGIIGGGAQIIAGAGICYVSVGTMCLTVGALLMVHGANNMYENTMNIIEDRNDTEGLTRKAYQVAAKSLNYGPREGNIAYYVSDVGLSLVGAGRLLLKPGTWKLFRPIPTDYVRAYKRMSGTALTFEAYLDLQTMRQIHEEAGK